MKIEYLQYFITLANSTSISKAAEELYISQQQLSRIIHSLEEEMNAKLIRRNTQGVSLTPEGNDFLKYAKNILKEYNLMKHHFYALQNQKQDPMESDRKECKVYLAPCFSIYASEIINNMKRIAPNIKLTIFDRTSNLTDGAFDPCAISFWAMDLAEKDFIKDGKVAFQRFDIGQGTNYLVFNKAHDQYDFADEHTIDFITAVYAHTSEYYKKDQVFFVSSNVMQMIDAVEQNNAVCTLPDFALPKIKPFYPDLAYIPIQNVVLPISVIYSSDYTLTEADEIVINFMKSYIQNLQLLANQIQ